MLKLVVGVVLALYGKWVDIATTIHMGRYGMLDFIKPYIPKSSNFLRLTPIIKLVGLVAHF